MAICCPPPARPEVRDERARRNADRPFARIRAGHARRQHRKARHRAGHDGQELLARPLALSRADLFPGMARHRGPLQTDRDRRRLGLDPSGADHAGLRRLPSAGGIPAGQGAGSDPGVCRRAALAVLFQRVVGSIGQPDRQCQSDIENLFSAPAHSAGRGGHDPDRLRHHFRALGRADALVRFPAVLADRGVAVLHPACIRPGFRLRPVLCRPQCRVSRFPLYRAFHRAIRAVRVADRVLYRRRAGAVAAALRAQSFGRHHRRLPLVFAGRAGRARSTDGLDIAGGDGGGDRPRHLVFSPHGTQLRRRHMTTRSETSEPAALRPRPRSMTRRVLLALFACIAVLALWAWLKTETLLRGAADLWIVSDEPAPADAVAVLGGGLEYRPFAAADYYRRGLAPKILISNIGATPTEQLGVLQSHVRANSEVLQKLGVPLAAIEPFGDHLSDTFTEATALHDWAVRNGAHRIIVPTDIFATRRLRWTLHHVFGNDAAILVPAVNPPDYQRDNWWKSERGFIGFQNEVMKYLYYRLKY